MTAKIYEITTQIQEYFIVPDLDVDISKLGIQNYIIEGSNFVIEVIDPIADYLELMKSIFDFDKLKLLVKGTDNRKPFKMLINSMNAGGLYYRRI